MKKITIFLSDSESIEINDDDNSPITEYSENIANILKNDNISILHISSGSVVIRPNIISAIKIDKINKQLILPPNKDENKDKEKNNKDKSINTITD